MSATRLLVLGVLRFMQPAHGYQVRRELSTWRLEDHTNVKPGSIYGALRTLHKDGCIAVEGRESADARPEKTTYTVTPEGEKEFQLLLREAWWTVRNPAEPLIPALTLMVAMQRDELVRALASRINVLEGQIEAMSFMRATIKDEPDVPAGDIPVHVREVFDFLGARTRAEIEWARTFQKRLRDGEYEYFDDSQD